MVLLDDVVEVAPPAHYDGPPSGILLAEESQGAVTGRVAVEIDFARPIGRVSFYGFSEKRLRRLHAPIGPQQVIDGFPVSVDSPVEIVPASADGYGGLIHAPGWVDLPCVAGPPALVLRDVSQDSSQDSRVRHVNSALGHHGCKVAVAQPVREVPADAKLNGFNGISTPTIDRVARDSSGH